MKITSRSNSRMPDKGMPERKHMLEVVPLFLTEKSISNYSAHHLS